jgi:hypothetical protein
MTAAHRPHALLALLTVLLGAALWPSPIRADHSWGPYHWERFTDPVALEVGDNVSPVWDAFLEEAIDDWNVSDRLSLLGVFGGTNPKNCRPVAGRIEVCNAAYGNTGWLGVAQIWVSGGHITQATTKLNDTYFNLPFYNTAAWRRFVMCQEVGHAFGLDHQDENFDDANLGSCMDYTNNPSGPPSNEHPNAHDYAELDTIYSHFDDPDTGGGGGNGNGRGRGGAPLGLPALSRSVLNTVLAHEAGEWGRAMRQHGRFALFDLNLGNDNHIFTFVVWA